MNCVVLILVVVSLLIISNEARPSEQERVKLWHDAGNAWPPNWQPSSLKFKSKMAQREEEIMALTGANERWENWMQFTQAQLVPKFSPTGFSLRMLPKQVFNDLNQTLYNALSNWDAIPEEKEVSDAIYGPIPPRLIPTGHMVDDILTSLRPVHEEWVDGMRLRGTSAYGIRVYTNGSSLVFHNDKPGTHVISSIVFLGAKYDDPNVEWPIQIEDHDGQMHEVNLKPGQMLHYESARCPHGRLKPFRGSWYAAIFVHYQPTNRRVWDYDVEDVIAAVPPHWGDGIIENEGSRWAGQALTFDSLAAYGAPSRIVEGNYIHDRISPYAYYANESPEGISNEPMQSTGIEL